MKDWRVALLRNLGYKPTKPNMEFLSTWQRWEGGHTKNDARFNWLNTTKDAPGALGSINSVGVKKFKSFEHGVQATAATLMNGRYDDVIKALASGDPYKFKPVAGLQTWVSGSPTGNPGYAQKILGGKASVPRPGVKYKKPNGAWDYAMGLIFEDDPEMIAIMQGLGDAGPTAPSAPPRGRAAGPGTTTRFTGKMLLPGTTWAGTHVTDGLGWGTKTAQDVMGAPGTGVGAPEDGTVVYFHPTGAQGGGSMKFISDTGYEYWLGHISNGVRPGRYKAGQRIAVIADQSVSAPHLHIDRRG